MNDGDDIVSSAFDGDGFVSLPLGSLKAIKKSLSDHAQSSGLAERSTRSWRRHGTVNNHRSIQKSGDNK